MTTLQQMIQQAPGRVSRRAQAVMWWLDGASQTAVAQRLGMGRQSVQRWCARFRAAGPAGLWDRPRTGRPPRGSAAVTEQVAACLRQSDRDGTSGPGGWTVARLVATMTVQGTPLSAPTLRRVLRRLRARWRRGRLAAKGDPNRLAVLQRLAKGLLGAVLAAQQAGRRLVVVFEDEADLALLAHAGYSWQLPDQPAQIPTPGQNQKVGLFGSLSLDGELVVSEAPRKTALALTAHLDQVMARFAAAEVVIIMDNVGIHHARATWDWLAAHPQVHPLFLPRYSPNDNAQERVWGWLREAVCRNRAYPDLASKRAAAQAFLRDLEPLALCQRCVPTRLLTGLLAEAFSADPRAPGAPIPPLLPTTIATGTDTDVTELLAA